MRGQGRVFRPVNGRGTQCDVWWLDYSVRGARHRESSGTTAKRAALEMLRQRIGERRTGKLIGNPEALTFADLRALVERQYQLDGLRTLTRVTQLFAHLEACFGAKDETGDHSDRAVDITEARLDAYTAQRLQQGAARATVNRELSILRRGFSLAIDKGMLARRPKFPIAAEHNAREGFFEDGDFAAVLLALPVWAHAVIRFLRFTGWRVTEALTLTWDRVDWEGGVLRLTAEQTKGKRARLFPFAGVPELQALLDAQWQQRDGLFVFQQDGRALSYDSLQHAFQRVCRRVGVARTIHDLRRTFARDMRRAGVSEGEIMALAGWRTRSMFDRYNVIDEQDLAAAVAKRYGKPTANIPAVAGSTERVSSSAVTREG